MIEDILAKSQRHMNTTLSVLKRELQTIRTGRAAVSLVEHIEVEAYGGTSPLISLATLAVPEARLLVVQPYDKNIMAAVERALIKSDLGITPSNDGTVIRLPFPPLTEERRRDLVKVVHAKVEEARVAVRNVRRQALEDLREAEKEKLCSQDDAHRATNELQHITDRMIEKFSQVGRDKERDVLEV